MSLACAQTNVQLFNQLRSISCPAKDLKLIYRAYDLAVELFMKSFRPSRKQFVAHLVGTASLLVWVRARPPVVAAGLLHAAYGLVGASPSRVRKAVGSDVERLIAVYTIMPWTSRSIPLIEACIRHLSPVYREVVLMRLVNELEDCLDAGILYEPAAAKRLAQLRSSCKQMVRMAKLLGYTGLGTQLGVAIRRLNAAEVPNFLRP